MRGKLVLLFTVVIVVIGLFWVGTHSYIEVRLQSAGGQDVIFEILDQSNNKSTTLTTKKTIWKKLVKKGDYEVLVKQGETSYLAITKTGRWLGTTTVNSSLTPEKHRQFIGDNPGPCAAYNAQVLVTFGCNDSYRNLITHMPATSKQPTYALKPSKDIEGFFIEGVVQTSEGLVAVLKRQPGADEESLPAQGAYVLNASSDLASGTPLKGLEDKKTYAVKAYKQGLLVYDDTISRLYYYPTRNSSPVEIDPETPDKMSAYTVAVSGDEILIASSMVNKDLDPDDPKSANLKGDLTIVNSQQNKRHVTLSKRYASLVLCGPSKLCTLHNKRLEVSDISGNKPKPLFSIRGVDQMNAVNGQLLVTREKEIFTIDTEKHAGTVALSLGGYSSCGLLPVAPNGNNGFTICLVDSTGKKVALLVDPSQPNKDSIDKKVAELLKQSEIKNLTAYGAFMTITPNVGEVAYDPKVKEFRYSPDKVQSATTAINQAIDRIGINRSEYQIRVLRAGG